jgi:hypothetical protein
MFTLPIKGLTVGSGKLKKKKAIAPTQRKLQFVIFKEDAAK